MWIGYFWTPISVRSNAVHIDIYTCSGWFNQNHVLFWVSSAWAVWLNTSHLAWWPRLLFRSQTWRLYPAFGDLSSRLLGTTAAPWLPTKRNGESMYIMIYQSIYSIHIWKYTIYISYISRGLGGFIVICLSGCCHIGENHWFYLIYLIKGVPWYHHETNRESNGLFGQSISHTPWLNPWAVLENWRSLMAFAMAPGGIGYYWEPGLHGWWLFPTKWPHITQRRCWGDIYMFYMDSTINLHDQVVKLKVQVI